MASTSVASLAAALLFGLILVPACENVPTRPPQAGDLYEVCASSVGRAALDAARAAKARGALPEVVRFALAAVQECPRNVPAHLLYLEAAVELGAAARAEAKAFYTAQDDGSPVWPFGRARFAENDASRLELLDEALRRAPSFYWAHFDKARMLRDLGRLTRAHEALRDALAARPDFAPARLALAEVLVELGRSEEAEPEYASYLRANRGDRDALRDYVRLLVYDLMRADAALPLVEELRRENPDDIEVLMALAAVHWIGRQPWLARDLYHRVLELDATAVVAALNLGNLYFERLVAESPQDKAPLWAKARQAYRYYLALGNSAVGYELWDRHVAVPSRLREIEAAIGPDDGRPPTLADF